VTNLVRKLTWVEGSRFNVSNIGNDVLFEAWMPTKDSRVERDVDLYTHAVLPNDVLEQMTNGQILVAIRQILYDQRENTDAIVTRAKAFYDFLQDGKTVTT
jgi:hypothetical protein